MALFDKRSPAEKLLDAYNKLSEEDKKEFNSHLQEKVEDVEKAEDEREIDKVEEEKADTKEVKDEKAEEVAEESEEIGKDVKEGETEETAEEEKEPEKEDEGEIEKAEEDVEEAKDNKIDALVEEFNIYKEKVDKLFAKLDELEEPEQSAGLGKQRSVEEAESDEDLSAYEYAMKHARY